ncbi:hypothetical protein TNCV_2067931 [Trichonephila clavipes]|uniref:Uncharacterized protein n=1 Tax=Trichonephila clavipes TaxID=2585209 RepID=A0A8X6W2N3_TRICX|nr:hypothetical protein TNCV_2067931 [Trichonephila clavipes]
MKALHHTLYRRVRKEEEYVIDSLFVNVTICINTGGRGEGLEKKIIQENQKKEIGTSLNFDQQFLNKDWVKKVFSKIDPDATLKICHPGQKPGLSGPRAAPSIGGSPRKSELQVTTTPGQAAALLISTPCKLQ